MLLAIGAVSLPTIPTQMPWVYAPCIPAVMTSVYPLPWARAVGQLADNNMERASDAGMPEVVILVSLINENTHVLIGVQCRQCEFHQLAVAALFSPLRISGPTKA